MACRAYRRTIIVGYGNRILVIAIIRLAKSNYSAYAPFFEQFVSSVVVGRAVRYESIDTQLRVKAAKLREGDDSADTIMAFRIDNSYIEWQIYFVCFVVC